MCKPIINVYSIENDTCEKYLKQYPCKLSVFESEEDGQLQVEAVEKFVDEYCNFVCDSESISEIYKEYTAKRFAERLVWVIN